MNYLCPQEYDHLRVIVEEDHRPRTRTRTTDTIRLQQWADEGYIVLRESVGGTWKAYITFKGIWRLFLYEEEYLKRHPNMTREFIRFYSPVT